MEKSRSFFTSAQIPPYAGGERLRAVLGELKYLWRERRPTLLGASAHLGKHALVTARKKSRNGQP